MLYEVITRLSFLKANGVPGILSLWYLKIDGKIYCATQKTAKIVSYLQKNPNCAFEIACDKPPYKGTRGEGQAKILDVITSYSIHYTKLYEDSRYSTVPSVDPLSTTMISKDPCVCLKMLSRHFRVYSS